MPIWITEFGWSTGQTSQPADYERAVSESQQATYLTQALEEFARFPQVRAAFWYTDVDHATPDPHQNGFGLMRTDGSRKPSYYAMKCAASGVCGPGAGP
jgi:beta-xylosidase